MVRVIGVDLELVRRRDNLDGGKERLELLLRHIRYTDRLRLA